MYWSYHSIEKYRCFPDVVLLFPSAASLVEQKQTVIQFNQTRRLHDDSLLRVEEVSVRRWG